MNKRTGIQLRTRLGFHQTGAVVAKLTLLLVALLAALTSGLVACTAPAEEEGLPTLVAHFVTPEGEPFPFDVTISDGTYFKEFNNVTEIETEVPTEFTLTYSYVTDGVYRTVVRGIQLSFELGQVRTFDFYALDWVDCSLRTRPYISAAEEPLDDVDLSWEYNTTTNTLSYNLTRQSAKWAMASVLFDVGSVESQNWAIAQGPGEGGGKCALHQEPNPGGLPNPPPGPCTDLSWTHITPPPPGDHIPMKLGGSVEFQPIAKDLGSIRIKHVMYRGSLVADVTDNVLLRTTNGTLVPQTFFDPQYAVPEGNYLLEIQDIPTGYFVPKLPVKVLAGVSTEYRKTILEINALRSAELTPWTFGIAAELDPVFSAASFSDLAHDEGDATLSVSVTTQAEMYDYWGYFILPWSATVTGVGAWHGPTGFILSEGEDYTSNLVGNHKILCVRIDPNTEHLEVHYALTA